MALVPLITAARGVNFLVDGQYGSTGKGLLAAYVAAKHAKDIDLVVTNGGPNSGHTFYYAGLKIVLKQLPSFAVYAKMDGYDIPVYISSGAIVDFDILNREVAMHNVQVYLSASAAVISPADKEFELSGSIAAVAGTRQGVGAALARKVLRDPTAIVRNYTGAIHSNIRIVEETPRYHDRRVFVEVSQGFSLGINSHFYPKVTSRECTVMQAMADARISPQHYVGTMMAIRTFPIRVGNIDGNSSGDWHSDQQETSWETIGVDPEMTTVTNRIRRVATFSFEQFREALEANTPRIVFVNFMNYLKPDDREPFARQLQQVAFATLGRQTLFLYGYGPYVTDVHKVVV